MFEVKSIFPISLKKNFKNQIKKLNADISLFLKSYLEKDFLSIHHIKFRCVKDLKFKIFSKDLKSLFFFSIF